MTETVFTRIAQKSIPAAIVYEDPYTIAFMDAGQVNPGHVIVASRKPFATILELDDETAAAVFIATAKVARAVENAFSPAGITVLQANRAAGWQTVSHFHIHILPRYEDDGVTVTWPRKEPVMEVLQEYAGRLTALL